MLDMSHAGITGVADLVAHSGSLSNRIGRVGL